MGLTAVATAFIAIFTIVLVRVKGRQARLTTAALNLRNEIPDRDKQELPARGHIGGGGD